MTIGDKVKEVCSPCVLDIPGKVTHGLEVTSKLFVFLYAFQEGPYGNIIYTFDDRKSSEASDEKQTDIVDEAHTEYNLQSEGLWHFYKDPHDWSLDIAGC